MYYSYQEEEQTALSLATTMTTTQKRTTWRISHNGPHPSFVVAIDNADFKTNPLH